MIGPPPPPHFLYSLKVHVGGWFGFRDEIRRIISTQEWDITYAATVELFFFFTMVYFWPRFIFFSFFFSPFSFLSRSRRGGCFLSIAITWYCQQKKEKRFVWRKKKKKNLVPSIKPMYSPDPIVENRLFSVATLPKLPYFTTTTTLPMIFLSGLHCPWGSSIIIFKKNFFK